MGITQLITQSHERRSRIIVTDSNFSNPANISPFKELSNSLPRPFKNFKYANTASTISRYFKIGGKNYQRRSTIHHHWNHIAQLFNLVAYEFQSNISVIVVFLGSHNAVRAVLESVKRQWNSSGNSIVWIAPDFWFLLERVILPGLTMGFNYIPLLHVHIYSLYMALHLSWQILCGFVRRDFTKTKPWPTTSWLNCQIQNLIVDVF